MGRPRALSEIEIAKAQSLLDAGVTIRSLAMRFAVSPVCMGRFLVPKKKKPPKKQKPLTLREQHRRARIWNSQGFK